MQANADYTEQLSRFRTHISRDLEDSSKNKKCYSERELEMKKAVVKKVFQLKDKKLSMSKVFKKYKQDEKPQFLQIHQSSKKNYLS